MPEPTSGKAQPLVTVAMPAYNAGKYLRLAVLSIINQTFTDWELLIIDDGSTDDSIKSIADLVDSRVRILRDGANKGLAARLNEAIDLARGTYFARMDQDDVSYPERFARQIEALQNDQKLDLVATRAITIDENSKPTGLFPCSLSHNEICARPWRGFYFPHPSWMGRIDWFRKHRYGEPGPYFCEDQELLLRSYDKSKFGTIDEILLGYRIRGQVNWQKLAKTRRTILQVQFRRFKETGQWFFILLAILTFAGRIAGDLVKFIRQTFWKKQPQLSSNAVTDNWKEVLSGLTDKKENTHPNKQVKS